MSDPFQTNSSSSLAKNLSEDIIDNKDSWLLYFYNGDYSQIDTEKSKKLLYKFIKKYLKNYYSEEDKDE